MYSSLLGQEGITRAIRLLGVPAEVYRQEVVSKDNTTGAERKQEVFVGGATVVIQPSQLYSRARPGDLQTGDALAYNYPWKGYAISDVPLRINDVLKVDGARYVVRLVQRYMTHYELYMENA